MVNKRNEAGTDAAAFERQGICETVHQALDRHFLACYQFHVY